MARGATNEEQMTSVTNYAMSIQPQFAMMNEERITSHEYSGAERGGYSGMSRGGRGGRGGYSEGQQYQRRGDVQSHVVYKNSKMTKKDFEKK